jgi:hypothetical protein
MLPELPPCRSKARSHYGSQAAHVSLQDLGSIGEFVAAIATIATLAYVAVQVHQNTRALRSSTFQGIAEDMSRTTEALATQSELSALMLKASSGLSHLTPEERVRYDFALLMVFRRLEAVYVQAQLGSIEQEMTAGFERSTIPVLLGPGPSEWWKTAKSGFSARFSAHVDAQLASGNLQSIHPDLGAPK